jgi:hypothetical protein
MLENIFARLKGKKEETSKDVNAFKESEEKKLRIIANIAVIVGMHQKATFKNYSYMKRPI